MQLGFVSAIVGELSFEEVFRFAATVGYQSVEVMCWPPGGSDRRYAGVSHLNVIDLNEARIADIRRVIDSTGVAISGLGYYPNCLDPDKQVAAQSITHLQKVIEAAPRLGVNVVNTFIGRDWKKSVEENWPEVIRVWRQLVQFAEDRGVRIAIENCPMLFTADEWPGGKNIAVSPSIWRRMFTDIPNAGFGLNYDPSHLVWQQINYAKPIREFGSRIFHVHAKDVRIEQDRLDQVGIFAHPKEYHTPKIPGLGDINWGRFFAELTEIAYRGPVCVEVEDRAFEGSLDDRLNSLRQSYRYLSNFV